MIRSMTAFARKDIDGDWGSLTCEIRSVNHRYLEPAFRLPENLRELENDMRDILRKQLRRGKVEVSLRLQLAEAAGGGLNINMRLAEELNIAANEINRLLDNPAHVSAIEVLRWPGVLQASQPDLKPVKEAGLALFAEAVNELTQVREREGARLRPLFDERLQEMSVLIARVRERMPQILEQQAKNLKERFAAACIELDAERLSQEMVMLAQKSDVAEEMDRLDAHLGEVKETLSQDQAIGRRLDFLMQELNREANTLSSKSIDSDVTRIAVDLKVLIEQMREQVQNIE